MVIHLSAKTKNEFYRMLNKYPVYKLKYFANSKY